MKNLTIVMCVVLTVLSVHVNAEDGKKKKVAKEIPLSIYVLIGGGNMAGKCKYNKSTDVLPKNKVRVLTEDGVFKYLKYSYFNRHSNIKKGAAQIGPGVIFVKTLLKANPNQRIGIISNCRAGSTLNQWEKGSEYFNKTVANIKKSLKYGKIKAILWMNGYTDRGNKEYLQKMSAFIKDLRKAIGGRDILFVTTDILDAPIVNPQINKLPKMVKNVKVISVKGMSAKPPWGTFDRASIDKIGELFAKKVLKKQRSKRKQK